MNNLRFAVIGSAHGHIYEFIEDMLKVEGEFVGIYDDHSPLVNKIARQFNVPIFKKLPELYAEGLMLVGTSAINNQKIDIIESCHQAGVNVIADKPIVTNHEQFTRLKNIIAEGKIQIGMMLSVRFMPPVIALKKIIDQGLIGKLINLEIFNPHSLHANNRPEWHFDKKQNGGIIVDLMPHSTDLFNWLTNDEIKNFSGVVQKSILPDREDFYDSAQFFVTSTKGITGYFRSDWHMTDSHTNWGDLRIFCTGTRGLIESRVLGDPLTGKAMTILFTEGKKTKEIALNKTDLSVTGDFIKRIKQQDFIIGHQDILKATEMALNFDLKADKINLLE